MPEPAGTFYVVTYEVGGDTESTVPLNIDIEQGRSDLHAAVDFALSNGASLIRITKQE